MHRSEFFPTILNDELDVLNVTSFTDLDRIGLCAATLRQLLALTNLGEGLGVRISAALDHNLARTVRAELDIGQTTLRDLDQKFLRVEAGRHPERARISRVEDLVRVESLIEGSGAPDLHIII